MAKKQKQLKSRPLDKDAVFIYPEDVNPNDSYNNPDTCLDPLQFVDERYCHECSYHTKCIYKKKYKYYKPN